MVRPVLRKWWKEFNEALLWACPPYRASVAIDMALRFADQQSKKRNRSGVSEQEAEGVKLTGTDYYIRKSVTPEGVPEYVLYRLSWNVFASAVVELARNKDRAVLEEAKRFLSGKVSS